MRNKDAPISQHEPCQRLSKQTITRCEKSGGQQETELIVERTSASLCPSKNFMVIVNSLALRYSAESVVGWSAMHI